MIHNITVYNGGIDMLIRCKSCNKSFEYEEGMKNCPICGEPISQEDIPAKPKTVEVAPIKQSSGASIEEIRSSINYHSRNLLSRLLKIFSLLILVFGLFAFFGEAFEGDTSSLFNYAFHPKCEAPIQGTNQTIEKNYGGITFALIAFAIILIIAIVALANVAKDNSSKVLIPTVILAALLAVFLIIYLSVASVDTFKYGGETYAVRKALGLGSVMLISSLSMSFVTGMVALSI